MENLKEFVKGQNLVNFAEGAPTKSAAMLRYEKGPVAKALAKMPAPALSGVKMPDPAQPPAIIGVTPTPGAVDATPPLGGSPPKPKLIAFGTTAL